MASLISSATDIQLQPWFLLGASVCKWTGYSKASTFLSTLIFSSEISTYLLYVMCYQASEKRLPQVNKSQKVMLELGLVFVAVVVPPLLLVYPIRYFGLVGAVCWVKSYEDESCVSQDGAIVLNWVLLSVFTAINVYTLVVYAVLVGIFLWLAYRSQRGRKHYLITARKTIMLLFLLFLCLGVHLVFTLIEVYHFDKESRTRMKWDPYYALSIISPLAQSTRPLVFMFYLNYVKKFSWESTRITAGKWRATGRLCCWRIRNRLWMLKEGRFSPSYISVFNDGSLINETREDFITPPNTSMSNY